MDTFIVLDIETTQNPITRKEELIEFGAIEINSNFERINEMSVLINPSFPLSFITKQVTGLSNSDLVGEKKLNDVMPKILQFLSNKPIIAHNACFDLNVLKHSCELCNLSTINNKFIDSLKIAKTLFPKGKNNLPALKEMFNIINESHRALEDVETTIKVLMNFREIYNSTRCRELLEDLDFFTIN